jgi:hypothetical protein
MKSVVRSFVTLAALGLAAAGPGGVAAARQPPAHLEEPPAAPERTPHGFVQIIEEALDELSLRPDQAPAVDQIVTQLEPLQAHVDDAESTLLLGLADQVKDGRIDRTALAPLVEGYANARQDVSADLRTTLQSLHALLDPTQREDLSDAVEARLHDVRRAMLSGERLDDFAAALKLREDQIQHIRDSLESLRPALEHERTVLHRAVEAFRDDDFQIERIMPSIQVPARARLRAELIIDLTASTMDLLDATQREALAARIRQAAEARSEGSDEAVDGRHPTTNVPKSDERTSASSDAWVAAGGVRRGPRGGVRGGVVVGGSRGFAYGRVRAFPVAAGWGYGW